MNLYRSTFKLLYFFLSFPICLLSGMASAQNLVTYAGNSGKESFNDVYRLPNGKILVAGHADNLGWTNAPKTVLNINLAPGQTNIWSNSSQQAFILLMNPQSTVIERVFVFPSFSVASVSRIRTTDDPTRKTDDSTFAVYISGERTVTTPSDDGYFIARLNGNFITGTGGTGYPTGCSWYFPVFCSGDEGKSAYKEIQPWDVGGDGQVVFGRGKAYSWDWASIEKLDATGKRTAVEHWPAHWSNTSELPSYRKASANPATAFSGIVLKAGRAGSLRSSITGDPFWNGYNWNLNTDERGNPRVGKFPDDFYFNKPFNGSNGAINTGGRGRLTNPATNSYGDSVKTYRTNTNAGDQVKPTARLGGIVIDRRNNHVYFGYSTKSSFYTPVKYQGKNWIPDFEPAVVAMTADGQMKWWARLYDQRGISPPDQYIDGVDIDYSGDLLVVLGRQHGTNTFAFWRGNEIAGNSAFQNNYTGVNTVATGHYSWIGKYDLIRNPAQTLPMSPVIKHCTYMMEYRDPAQGLGSPSSDPKLDGWPTPNSGFPDLNTTRFTAPGRVAVTPGGAVCVIGNGRRVITTSDAFQKMPKQSTGSVSAWSNFIRIYLPDLSGLMYSTLLTGKWDTLTGVGGSNTDIEGLYPYNGGIYAVGSHAASSSTGEAQGNPIPTVAIPAWGNGAPQNQSAIFARFRIDRNYPISVQLNPNVFCAMAGNNTFPIKFTPPAEFLTQFNPGNVFRVEISAPNGRFAGQGAGGSTTVIGTLASTSNGQQTISATFPPGLAPGTNYGLRVRALNPLIPGPGTDTIPGYWYNVTIVNGIPTTPGVISGETLVCGNAVATSTYSVRKSNNAITYEWEITPTVANFQDPCNLPTCAGVIGGSDTSAVVVWNPNFSGQATIRVRAKNPCGISPGWSVLDKISIAPCITTSFTGSVCAGPNTGSVIPFTIPSGVSVAGVNSFTAQLSDQNGAFGTPVNIGSVSNIPGGAGPITSQINGFTIPVGTVPSPGYRIRVVGTGTTPAIQGFPSENLTIRTPPSKPTVPVGINRFCYNNIRTGTQDVAQIRSSGGRVLLVISNHGLANGQQIYLDLQAPAPTQFNGLHTVTVVNNNDVLLNGTSYAGTTFGDPGVIRWNYFTTTPMLDASYYEWSLSNPELASFQTNNDPGTVLNFNLLEGSSWVKVRAVNECGAGPWSDSIQIFVESCLKINLEPNSVWCPGAIMDRTSPGGSVKLRISKAGFTSYFSSSNYRVEISDPAGSFVSPVYSGNVLWFSNQALTGRVTGVTNGPGKILLTIPNHGFSSGANIRLADFGNGYGFLNNTRDSITVIDANTIRLERASLCSSNCNFSPLATVSGHDLLSPIEISVPLPATMVPSNFYQVRVSCFNNCSNNGSSINGPLVFSVGPPPAIPSPTGNTTGICGTTATYSIPSVSGAVSYAWSLVPATAGTVTGTGNSVSISFNNTYTGPQASLSVTVTTACGQTTSTPLVLNTNCNPPVEPPPPTPVAGSYRSKNSGAWKNSSNWEVFNGSWGPATAYPGNDGTANDDPNAQFIYIGGWGSGSPASASNHTITLDGALSADQIVVWKNGSQTGNLTVNANATLTILNGAETFDCQVFGDLRIQQDGNLVTTGRIGVMNLGRYRHNYSTTAGTIPAADWFPGSTCSIEGYTTNTTPPSGLGQMFQNFVWNTPGLSQTFNLKGQLNQVLGKFTNQDNNGRYLALTDNSTPIFIQNLENRDRLYLNTGNQISASNTLTVGNFTNLDGDVLGSSNAAAGNLVVNQDLVIQKAAVALTGSSGSPFWVVSGNVSIPGDGRLLGNRGGSGFSVRMDVAGDLTINNGNAWLAGSNGSNANFILNIGGNLSLQNGNINDYNTGGNFTVNVKGNYSQTGGKLEESWVNLVLNTGGDFSHTGGTIGGAGGRGSMTFGFTGSGNQNLTLSTANYNGNRVSVFMNKTGGQLIFNQATVYQNFTWIKGDLNLNSTSQTGNGQLLINGTGNVGALLGSGSALLRHRWLKAQSGILTNASDRLIIYGGSGGAVNKLSNSSYVTDFLQFDLAPKLISNATFSMNGGTPSTITLTNHGLQDGDIVVVAGTTNDGGAFNGTYTIRRTGTNTFSLNGTSFPGNWNSNNTGTLTRIDEFEIPIGNAGGFMGFGFQQLRNDNNLKSFRISVKASGPAEANGVKIQQVGLVPGILGKNWRIERLSGSGALESLLSVSMFQPAGTASLRVGQSNTSPGSSGYTSRGGLLSEESRILTTKALDLNAFNQVSGTWFAFGSAASVTPPPGGFNVPGQFQNLTEVAAEYNDVTFTGPAVFTLGSGYDGRDNGTTPERFPIVFSRKQSHPVTIKVGAANRETSNGNLNAGSNTPLVVLDGVNNITFDGQHSGGNWKLVNFGTGDSANVFRLVNGSSNHILRNLDIQASGTGTGFSGAVLLGSSNAASGNSNNQILNNKIRNNQASKKPLYIKTIKQTLAPGYRDGGIIIEATNTTPVWVRTAVKHGYSNGQRIRIRNVSRVGQDHVLTGASNASPIVITSANHGLITGNRVFVGKDPSDTWTGKYAANVAGNTNANGIWFVTVLSANTFSLNGSSGNGAFIPPAPNTNAPTWTCMDPVIMDNDYHIKTLSDSTFELFRDAALNQPYAGRGKFGVRPGGMSGADSRITPVISNISGTTPVIITTSANHQLKTGQTVQIEDSASTPTTRTRWVITVLTPTTFSLNTSTPASFPGSIAKWRFVDPPLIAVTSVPHGLVNNNVISIQGVVFPPNANGNFQVTTINDTTIVLNNTYYYHTPYFGGANLYNHIAGYGVRMGFLGNTTPIQIGTSTNGFNASDPVTLSGNTDGIVPIGDYRLWPGGDQSRQVFLLNTRRIERPYQGTPSAFLDAGISRGIVSNNQGTTLNELNVIRGNSLENTVRDGLLVTSAGNGSRWKVEDNHFYFSGIGAPMSGSGRDFTAFNFIPGIKSNDNLISGNYVGGSQPFHGGSPLVFGLSSGQYTQVIFSGFKVNVGNQVATRIIRNRMSNINGTGPGYKVQQNNNNSSGSSNSSIIPNAGLFSGIHVVDGLASVGSDSYEDANWYGDTLAREDFAIDMYGEGALIFGFRSSSSSAPVIQKNIIGNVNCRGRQYSSNGAISGIFTDGTGSPKIVKNIIRRVMGIPATAIRTISTGQDHLIDSNNIKGMIVGGNGMFGIHISGSNNGGIVRKNRFYESLCLPNNGVGNSMSALHMEAAGGGQGWTVHNNQLSMNFRLWGGRYDDQLSGIRHQSSSGVPTKYYFNTVYLSGPLGDPGWSSASFRKAGDGPVVLRNNIFYNETGGGSGVHYGIAIPNTTNWNGNQATNNLFYAQGGNSFLGLFNTTQISDVNTWEGFAGGTNNLESYIEWKFPQPDTLGRLQLSPENCPIKDKGFNVNIFDDYDSLLVRDKVKPDIGSHEFSNELPLGAYWVGGINNDWHLEGNWCDEKVPQSFEDVTISNLPRRKNMPIVSTEDAVCRNINIVDNPGSMLTVWGDQANLTLFGDSGKIRFTHHNLAHISGAITFGGDTVQNIPAPVTDLSSNRRNLDLLPMVVLSANVTGTGAVIRTAVNHNLTFGEFVKFTKIKGVLGLEGSFKINQVLGPDQFEILGSFSGTYVPRSGFAIPLAVLPIRTITNNPSSLTIQTSKNHNLQNDQYVAITGVKGNNLANGAFKIFNANGDKFDIPVKTGNLFVQDTNAVVIPSRTGYYDLRLTGSQQKFLDGSIQAGSLRVTGIPLVGNRKSIELRDSLVAENRAVVRIDSGTVTVGGGIGRGSFQYGIQNPIQSAVFGLIVSDSSQLIFNNSQTYFVDSMVTRKSGTIELKRGNVYGEFIHAGRRGVVQQGEANVTLFRKLVSSSGGNYRLGGTRSLLVHDSIWVRRNGLIETLPASTGDLVANRATSMLGGTMNLAGSGNLNTNGLLFSSGKIFTTATNRVILPASTNTSFSGITGGSDSSFVHGRLSHWFGRASATPINLATTGTAIAGGEFVIRTASNHNLSTGDLVLIQGVTSANLTRCNGIYPVNVIDGSAFRLIGSVAPVATSTGGAINGTMVRLYSRVYAVGKDNEYREFRVHMDHGDAGANALSVPLASYDGSNGQSVYTTTVPHNFKNRQAVSIVNSGQGNIGNNDIRYIRVISPTQFQIFQEMGLFNGSNPGNNPLSPTATVVGHSEYTVEAFNTRPDSLKMPSAQLSWFGTWTDLVKSAHQGRYFRVSQISHLPGPFKFNGGGFRVSYKQNEISPSFHNNKYLTLVKDSLWPTPASDRWIHLRGNNVDSLQPLRTIQSVRAVQTPGVVTLGFMNIIPCNHRADAGKDTTLCHNQQDSLGTRGIPGYSYRWRRLDPWEAGSFRSDSLRARLAVKLQNTTPFSDTIRFELTMSRGLDCEKKDTVQVIVLPQLRKPVIQPSGALTYCQNPNNTRFVYTSSFETYTWEVFPSNAGQVIGEGDTVEVDWNDGYIGLAKVVLKVTNRCGTSPASDTVRITINPGSSTTPSRPVSGSGVAFCTNPPNINLTVTPVAGATSYVWLVTPSSAGTITGNSASAVFDAANAYVGFVQIQVKAITSCGETTPSDTLRLDITPGSPQPNKPATAGDTVLCSNPANSLIFTNKQTGTYQWVLDPPVAGTILGDTHQVQIDWADAYSGPARITVQVSGGCGLGPISDTLHFQILGPLVKPATPSSNESTNLCQNPASSTVFVSDPQPGKYLWTVIPPGAAPINPEDTTASISLNWDDSFTGQVKVVAQLQTVNCGLSAVSDTFFVNIGAGAIRPDLPTTAATQLCQGVNATSISTNPGLGIYRWGIEPPTAGTFSDSTSTVNLIWTPGFQGNVLVYVVNKSSCGLSNRSDTLELSMLAIPLKPDVPFAPLTSFCSGVDTTRITTGTGLGFYRWSVVPASAGTFQDSTFSEKLFWAPGFTGSAKVVVMARNFCGIGPVSDTITLTVGAGPSVPATPVSALTSLCPGASPSTLSTGSGPGVYYWSVFPASAGNITDTSETVVLTWNPSFTGPVAKVVVQSKSTCGLSSPSDTLTFQFDVLPPVPGLPTAAITSRCSGTGTSVLSTAGGIGVYRWSVVPATAGSFEDSAASVIFTWDPLFEGEARFVVQSKTDCGISAASDTLRITVTPGPPAPQTPVSSTPGALCPSQNSLISTGTVATKFLWEVIPSAAVTLQPGDTTSSISLDWDNGFSGIAKVVVKTVSSCGISPSSDTLSISLLPGPDIPPTPTTPTQVVCASQNVTVTSAAGAGKYEWEIIPSDAYTLQPGDTGSTLNLNWNTGFTGSVKLVIRAVSACGVSAASDTLRMTVQPGASTPATPSSAVPSLCPALNSQVSTTPGLGKYLWEVIPASAYTIQPGDTNAMLDVNWNDSFLGNVKLVVRTSSPCGTSLPSDTLILTLEAGTSTPATPATAVTSLCPALNSQITTTPGLGKYLWEVIPAGAYTLQPGDTNASLDVNWNDAFFGTVKLVVRTSSPCGVSLPSDTLTLTLEAGTSTPSTPATAVTSLCPALNSQISTTPGLGKYQWEVIPAWAYTVQPSDTLSTLNVDWNDAFSGIAKLVVRSSSACGISGPSDTLTMTLTPGVSQPARPVATVSSLCSIGNSQVSTTAGLGKYLWEILPAGAYTVQPGDTNSTLNIDWTNTFGGQARIVVRVQSPCGTSPVSDTLRLNLIAEPLVPDAPSSSVTILCPALNSTVSTSSGPGQYVWEVLPAEAYTVLPTDTASTLVIDWNNSFTGTAKVVVRSKNPCGVSAPSDTLTFTLSSGTPAPSTPVSAVTSLCPSLNSEVSTTPGAGKYLWEIHPSGAATILPGDTNASLTIDWNDAFLGTAKVLVHVVSACGTSAPSDTLVFQIQGGTSTPSVPTSPVTTLCPALNSEVSTTTGLGRYQWEILPSGAYTLQPGDTNASLSINWNDAFLGIVKIVVRAKSVCGISAVSDTLEITLQNGTSQPAAPVSSISNPCTSQLTEVSTSAGLGRYLWEVIPASAYTVQPGDTNASLAIQWSNGFSGQVKLVVRSLSVCGTSIPSDTLFLTVNPGPATPAVPTTGVTSLCPALNSVVSAATGAGKYLWEVIPAAAYTVQAGDTTPSLTINWSDSYTGLAGIVVKTESACGISAPSDTLWITLQSGVATPATPTTSAITLCPALNSLVSTNAGSGKFLWEVYPAEAYTVQPGDTNPGININWADGYFGIAKVVVRVQTVCGTSPATDTLFITLQQGTTTPTAPSTSVSTLCPSLNSLISTTPGLGKYLWEIIPIEAGTVQPGDTNAQLNVNWNDAYFGTVRVVVRTQSACGLSGVSDTLQISLVPGNPAPGQPVSSAQNLCINGPDTEISSTPGQGKYLWSVVPAEAGVFSDTTATVLLNWNNTFSGTARITVRSQTACGISPSSDTLTLVVSPKLPTNILNLDTAYCQKPGTVVELQGEPAGGSFFVNGSPLAQLPISQAGLFRVRYEKPGCYDTSGKWVKVNPRVTTTLTGLDTLYCLGNNPVTMTGFPAGGVFGGPGVTGNTFVPNVAGNHVITYSLATCSDTARKLVKIRTAPLVSISSPNLEYCQDTAAKPLVLSPAGGQLLVNGLAVSQFRPLAPGNNILIYLVRTGSCVSSDTLQIRVDTRPIVNLQSFGIRTLCGFDTLVPLFASPPGGFYNSPAVVDSNLNPKFLPPGPHRITYYALNGVCRDSASLNFNILAVPLVDAGRTDTFCLGGPFVNLTGFNPAGGFWTGPNLSGTGVFNPVQPGISVVYYKIPAQPGFSCPGRDSKVIYVTPKPRIRFPADTVICEGSSILLNPLYGLAVAWRWQDGSTKPFYEASQPGKYTVAVSDKFCTWTSDTFTIKARIPLPAFSLGRDSNACFNKPVLLKGPSNMAWYEWTLADSNEVLGTDSILELRDPASVRLTVKTKAGACYYSDEIVVNEVLCDEIFIPQAFSPNGDGENDHWKIFGISLDKLNLKVFNEWGECVYFSTDLEDKWDGTYNGKKCPPGGYQYIIEYQGVTPRGRKFKERKAGVLFLVK